MGQPCKGYHPYVRETSYLLAFAWLQDSLPVWVDEYLCCRFSSQRQTYSGAPFQKLPKTSSGGGTGGFSIEIVEQRRVD